MTAAPAPETQPHGEVFTRRWVVDTLLDLTGYTADRDLAALRLVEPSCGSGAFVGPVVERLLDSAAVWERGFAELDGAIRAYDLQPEHVATTRALCRQLLVAAGATATLAQSLACTWVNVADFLQPPDTGMIPGMGTGQPGVEDAPADVVIGNPPYIRYDDLPAHTAAVYRDTWSTMRGRGDIYIGFIQRSLEMLNPGGRVGFICADRWMRNQYGAALRDLVAANYSVEHVWTMHDVDAFETTVSAYPAITVMANTEQGPAIVAQTTSEFDRTAASTLAASFGVGHHSEFSMRGVRAHRLPHWFRRGTMWPTGSPKRLALIERLNDRSEPLHDLRTGTRVSIGVATGADKAYVTTDPEEAEADRMLPLATSKDLSTGTFRWQGTYLINPWNDDGSLVPLVDYPRMTAYLEAQPSLRDRFGPYPVWWTRGLAS